MFIHIGNDYIINEKDIVAVFDIDNSSISVKTRNFLSKAEKEGKIINIATDIPRSFIICSTEKNEHTVYLSQLSSSTLFKRINKKIRKLDFDNEN